MQPLADPPIGLLAAAVRRAIKAAVLAHVAPLGLSSLQFWVVVAVAEQPGGSQCELAALLHIDEPTASRVVRSLRTRGLLRATRERTDRRRVRLELTERGAALASRLVPLAARMRAAVEEPLAPAERERTRAALQKIVTHLGRIAADQASRRSA